MKHKFLALLLFIFLSMTCNNVYASEYHSYGVTDTEKHLIEEEKAGVFRTNSHVNIINTQNNQIHTYNLEDVPKSLHTKNDIICVNTGTELYLLNTNGWLIKKYSTNQEITNVIFSEHLAGIIYKDKVVIVDL